MGPGIRRTTHTSSRSKRTACCPQVTTGNFLGKVAGSGLETVGAEPTGVRQSPEGHGLTG